MGPDAPEQYLSWRRPADYEGLLTSVTVKARAEIVLSVKTDAPREQHLIAAHGGQPDPWWIERVVVGYDATVTVTSALDDDLTRGLGNSGRTLGWHRWAVDMEFSRDMMRCQARCHISGPDTAELLADGIRACGEMGGWPEVEAALTELLGAHVA